MSRRFLHIISCLITCQWPFGKSPVFKMTQHFFEYWHFSWRFGSYIIFEKSEDGISAVSRTRTTDIHFEVFNLDNGFIHSNFYRIFLNTFIKINIKSFQDEIVIKLNEILKRKQFYSPLVEYLQAIAQLIEYVFMSSCDKWGISIEKTKVVRYD